MRHPVTGLQNGPCNAREAEVRPTASLHMLIPVDIHGERGKGLADLGPHEGGSTHGNGTIASVRNASNEVAQWYPSRLYTALFS